MAPTTYKKVADFFIYTANECGSYISNLKLQKLLYYAQAWFLALENEPLFEGDFEAWVHGPVLRKAYNEYKSFGWQPIIKDVKKPRFNDSRVTGFLNEIVNVYFHLDAFTLESLTHQETPWVEARAGLPQDASSNNIIKEKTMKKFYKSLQ